MSRPPDLNTVYLTWEICSTLHACLPPKEQRPRLDWVHLTPEYVESCNGHIVVRIPLDTPYLGNREYLLDREAVRAVNRGERLAIDIPSESGRILDDNGVVSDMEGIIRPDEPPFYPDLGAHLADPGDNVRRVAFSGQYLKDLGLIVKRMGSYKKLGARNGRIVFNIPPYSGAGFVDGPCQFSVNKDGDIVARGVLMPMKIED